MDWKDEVNTMLAALNRQAMFTLKNIEVIFKQQGVSFNPMFRQYFVQTSKKQFEESYDQFNMASKFHDRISARAFNGLHGTFIQPPRVMAPPLVPNPMMRQIPLKTPTPIIEICDSDDDEKAMEIPKTAIDRGTDSEELSTTGNEANEAMDMAEPNRFGGRESENQHASDETNNKSDNKIVSENVNGSDDSGKSMILVKVNTESATSSATTNNTNDTQTLALKPASVEVPKRSKCSVHANVEDRTKGEAKICDMVLAGAMNILTHTFSEKISIFNIASISQPCKPLQNFVGNLFWRYYSADQVDCNIDGIHINDVKINSLNRFIRNISISIDGFQWFRSNSFDSLKQITFNDIHFIDQEIFGIQKILCQIEVMRLYKCDLDGDFYEKFLMFCPNLEQLTIRPKRGTNGLIGTGNDWLLRKYPKLEDFELLYTSNEQCLINELKTFLDVNSSIHSLTIDAKIVSVNYRAFLEANLKLNELTIVHNYESIREILNELWNKGSFKKLHLWCHSFNITSDQMRPLSLPPIEMLYVRYFDEQIHFERFNHLKEVKIDIILRHADMELLAKNLINVNKITISRANKNVNMDNMLHFIRYLPKLTEIKVDKWNGHIDLLKLNEERKKLTGACKVVLYVPETVYLATKKVLKDIDLHLVRIERTQLILRESLHFT